MRRTIALIVALILFLSLGPSQVATAKSYLRVKTRLKHQLSQVIPTTVGQIEINWKDGIILATGHGAATTMHLNPAQVRALAMRMAIHEAQEILSQTIHLLYENSHPTYVKLKTKKKPSAREKQKLAKWKKDLDYKIKLIVKNMTVMELEVKPDNSVKIQAAVPLYGKRSVGELIYPTLLKGGKLASEVRPLSLSQIGMLRATKEEEKYYTGLIIDAYTTDLEPALNPAIFAVDGQEIYGTLDVDPEYVITIGIASYANSLEEAKKNFLRVGKKPLIVKAINAKGPFNEVAIINTEDAQKIKKANQMVDFLKRCKVIFITR